MVGYPVKIGEKEVIASGLNLPISTKNSTIVCKKINKMDLEKAKKFLEDLIKEKRNINGKHFTKTSEHILEILLSAENNIEYKGLDKKNFKIKTISAERGPTRMRRRRKRAFGAKLKNTHIKVVLESKKSEKSDKDERKGKVRRTGKKKQ
jgi:ribosomal protein L22